MTARKRDAMVNWYTNKADAANQLTGQRAQNHKINFQLFIIRLMLQLQLQLH